MPTQSQKDAEYHCGIGDLLRAAYQRDFDMMEMGKCKTKFRTFNEWHKTLTEIQKLRVKKHLDECYPTTNLR